MVPALDRPDYKKTVELTRPHINASWQKAAPSVKTRGAAVCNKRNPLDYGMPIFAIVTPKDFHAKAQQDVRLLLEVITIPAGP